MKRPLVSVLLLACCGLASAAEPAAIRCEASPYPTIGSIERLDPALDAVLAADAPIEVLAENFRWSEGPVWRPATGDLLFSDVPANTVYRWREASGAEVYLAPSGDTGTVAGSSGEGANGLALDAAGRLVLCQHGDRRVARLGADGKSFEVLAERFEGKRFNSPNDLCFDHAGNLFFTDPPYGLARNATSELGFSGVFRRACDGAVTLLSRELDRPNGIALSPDEKTLYVANSGERTFVAAFELHADGSVGPVRVLFDGTPLRNGGRAGLMDGLKVDTSGNLWATGPGGVLILSAEGKHLGTILTTGPTANCSFGGAGGTLLFITSNNRLLRVATRTRGAGY
ncbi:MAG TPA: SMP-30/gluconolactonase/LRE family protein [Opitutaceae bacterium]|nr:SMP-30/gluconolactonase/LRE family protein [Opitutaceae bacterium]